MLEVKDLSISVRATGEALVKSLSFNVEQGGTLGLVGESGSGKSMSCKAILGLLNPRLFVIKGSVRWKGIELLTAHDKTASAIRGWEIGMITQTPMSAFAPMVRLEKQIEMGYTLRSSEERKIFRRDFSAALETVKLRDFSKIMNSYPDEFSGGMLQRVMIANVMLQRPELLICDECTTAVDALSETIILRELEKLNLEGMAMIVVTHDFGVAARLTRQVAVMKAGEIIETGETLQVFHSPRHPYTKQLTEASVLFKEEPCSRQ